MTTTCPKCHYVRLPTDAAPDYACPQCGVVYEKARPGINETPEKPDLAPMPSAWGKAEKSSMQIDCECCGGMQSFFAKACPHCGHPNQDAPNPLSVPAGVIAVAFGVSSIWAPYFAAPLLIPIAIAITVIAFANKSNATITIILPIIASVLIGLAAYRTYQTSQKISKAADEIAAQAKKSGQALFEFQERLRSEQARSQESLDQALRQLNR